MTEDDIISGILKREGWPTFTNDPGDRGGPTKGGVTLESWRAYSGNAIATAEDISALSEADVRGFYRKVEITDPHFDQIADSNLRTAAIDWSTMSGPRGRIHTPTHPIEALQTLVGATADGELGPASIASINASSDPRKLLALLCRLRMIAYARICQADPSQLEFFAGWTDRVFSFVV